MPCDIIDKVLLEFLSGSRPRAVGKRTPRFPVSFSHENPMGEKYFSPSRQSLKLQADDSDTDEDVKIALVLTEASQRGGSPQVSQTPNRWTDSAMSSPAETAGRKVLLNFHFIF